MSRAAPLMTVAALAATLTTLLGPTGCGSEDPGGAADGGGTLDAAVGACATPSEPTKDLAGCLDDDFGVYVSPTGSDGDPGTKDKPFKTLQRAAAASRQRIVVCEGDYAGGVTLTRDVEVYSGVRCTFDKPGGRARFVGVAGKEAALVVESARVRLVDVEAVGAPNATPGGSSIGLRVAAGATVDVVRGVVRGGTAGAGADGVLTPFTLAARATAGNAAVGDQGGAASVQVCPSGGNSGAGGRGGVGTLGMEEPGSPGGPSGTGGAGGTIGTCGTVGTGKDAPDAPDRAAGEGAKALGTLTNNAWVPGKGTGGQAGEAGRGGGGGAGGGGGGGGGGGAGGCGGAGGGGGGGGGGSFALLSLGATVNLVSTELVSGKAGTGGKGAAGQAGQSGGFPGVSVPLGCNGGVGGKGGAGGAGGGGAGGVSVALGYAGKKPTSDAASKLTADATNAGAPGVGGAPGTNDGVAGQALPDLELK